LLELRPRSALGLGAGRPLIVAPASATGAGVLVGIESADPGGRVAARRSGSRTLVVEARGRGPTTLLGLRPRSGLGLRAGRSKQLSVDLGDQRILVGQ